MTPPFDAVLLAGGGATRLGGVDKPSLPVGGVPMVRRAVQAVAGAHRVIVVGPDPGMAEVDVVTREDPPGGGPVAALAAGLTHVASQLIVVLAADLPFVDAAAVARLLATLEDDGSVSAAFPVDGDGRDQPLLAAWRTAALASALDAVGDPSDASVRRLIAAASPVIRLSGFTSSDGTAPPWFDCDTADDLALARRWADREVR